MQIRRLTFIASVTAALAVGLFAGAAGAGNLNAVFAHIHAINTLLTGTNVTLTAPVDESSLSIEYMPPPDGLDTSVNVYSDEAGGTAGVPIAVMAIKTTLGPRGRHVTIDRTNLDAYIQVAGDTTGSIFLLSDLDRVTRVDGLLAYVSQNIDTISSMMGCANGGSGCIQ